MVFALRTLLLTVTPACASNTMIVGYEPGSDVEQHSFIDLDQKELESHLDGSPDWAKARQIYTLGGHSGGYAEFTVPSLASEIPKLRSVSQTGSEATGRVKSAASQDSTTLKVAYTSVCKEGGTDTPDTTGCFSAEGELQIEGDIKVVPSAVANKYRTLQGFSVQAEVKMKDWESYKPYKTYYEEFDYGNQYVLDALNGDGLFSGQDDDARVQGVKKGTAYMNVWMYVIHEMEDAIQDCKVGCIDCNADPVHAWDEAVAFYAGSLEGVSGSSDGKMLYRLAEKRCLNFRTCTGADGIAAVNDEIVKKFRVGQEALQKGECAKTRPIMERIIQLMSIPMVQGSLRYAYKVANLQGKSKEIAEGAVFSAAVLPQVHACNATAAKIISDNMAINANAHMKDGFTAVKEAFESTYECLGITCADVGGLVINDKYYEGAEPCVTSPGSSSGTSTNPNDTDTSSAGEFGPFRCSSLITSAALIAAHVFW